MIEYPNTFPFPNEIINGWNAKLKGSELKVLLVIVRKTLGWVADPETGMRKEEDYISYSQMKQLTGLSTQPLSSAIESLVKYKLIQVRNKKEELLDTAKKREYAGRRKDKFIYRLNLTVLKSKTHCFENQNSTVLKSKSNKINSLQNKLLQNNNLTSSNIRQQKYLKDIPLEDIQKFSKKFGFSENQIKYEAEKCLDWLLSKGRQPKNYQAQFRNWLRNASEFRKNKQINKGFLEGFTAA